MQNRWGTYPWFTEHGLDKIHPNDLDNFKKEAHNCKVFECVNEDAQFITLKYGDNIYKVKNDLFRNVPVPMFRIGQKVQFVEKSDSEVMISDIMWHYDRKEHYYIVAVAGKKKTKRYSDTELRI